jgi:hypothetical protein
MQETHSTETAIAIRIRPLDDEYAYEYHQGRKLTKDNLTLPVAHYLVFRATNAIDDQFELNMQELLDQCWEDFKNAWTE